MKKEKTEKDKKIEAELKEVMLKICDDVRKSYEKRGHKPDLSYTDLATDITGGLIDSEFLKTLESATNMDLNPSTAEIIGTLIGFVIWPLFTVGLFAAIVFICAGAIKWVIS